METQGCINVIGLGAGTLDTMTGEALSALLECDIVVGYEKYVDQALRMAPGKNASASGMGGETERCREALRLAAEGKRVALVSSGDPGVYGMAGLMLEIGEQAGNPAPIRIIPGISAALIGAAALGAPLMNDFAVLSLSDLLTPWNVIEDRLRHAAEADLVICLYNPKSKGRTRQIERACEIIGQSRPGSTPAGIVRQAGQTDQAAVVTRLDDLLNHAIDMSTVVIIGCQATRIVNGRMVTPRGYVL